MIKVLLAIILMLAVTPNISFAAKSSSFDADLDAYLKEISATRGMPVTKDDIEKTLSNYDEKIADFDSMDGEDGLKSFLGDVIKGDYSNLTDILKENNLSLDELKALLKENGEDINDYVFVDDLDEAVFFYLYPDDESNSGIDEDMIKELLPMFQEEFDLTEQEITNLKNHFMKISDKLSTPEAINQMEQLSQRMEAFSQFSSLDELTANDVQEILSIYDELFSMLELKVNFYLVKGNKETPLSLLDLMKMENLINAKLEANIYDLDGNLLADLIITGDMVDSGTVKQIGKNIDTAAKKVEKVTSQKPVVKTVKGGQLPNTAGNYVLNILIGFIILLAGILGFRYYRKAA